MAKKNEVTLAPVDNYPERPDSESVRTVEEAVIAEGRALQVDQDPTYHERHPPTDVTGPQYDAELVQQTLAAANAVVIPKKVLSEAVEDAQLT